MRWLADVAYLLAGLLYLPVALYNALVLGKNRHGWGERFGAVPILDPTKQRIWVHAVSLGEINCTPRLIDALRESLPDCEIVFSTTTDTGYARAIELYGHESVFRFPLDFSPVMARALTRISPSLVLLVELEVWYNLVRMATDRGIPVAVVNGRLTARSARRFARLGRLIRRVFADLAWVGAQDESIADRFSALGTRPERVEVTSSLKWDSASVTDHIDGADELARAMGIAPERPLWVCGSTGPGEELMILDAYRQLLRDWAALAQGVHDESAVGGGIGSPSLAIVPRKPERFDEVARIVEGAGFSCVRRSDHRDGGEGGPVPESCVLLGDTMGELRKFYSLADVVLVGRSLVPMGGSDPMEVAALGKPVVVGPYTDNFRVPVEALAKAEAIRIVPSAGELPAVVGTIVRDVSLAKVLGSRAREVVIRNQGATRRTADRVVRLLHAD